MRLLTIDLPEEFIDWFPAAPFDRSSDHVADHCAGAPVSPRPVRFPSSRARMALPTQPASDPRRAETMDGGCRWARANTNRSKLSLAGTSRRSPAAATAPPMMISSKSNRFTSEAIPIPSQRPSLANSERAASSPAWAALKTVSPVTFAAPPGQLGEHAARVRRCRLTAVASQSSAGCYRLKAADVAAAALVRAARIDDDMTDFSPRQHRYGVQFPERGQAGGWSAWPERVAGAAWPLAGLAALVSPGLPGVPGLLPEQG